MRNMKIYYDKKKSAEIEKKLFDKWSKPFQVRKYRVQREKRVAKRGSEYHISDAIGCEVKCFCRLKRLKRSFTKRSVGLMLFGIVAQKLVQWLYPEEQSEYEAGITDVVVGHLDVFEDELYPIEIKASRRRIFRRNQLPQRWVEQLASYMALTSSKKGWVVILNVFSCQVACFCVEMTEKDILGQLVVISGNVAKRRRAVNLDRPTMLIPSGEEYEYCFYKQTCPRRIDCREKWKRIQQRRKKV